MKKIWKIIIGIAVLLVVLLGILHIVLQVKIGAIVKNKVIPEVEKKLKINVSIGDAGLNLLGGVVHVSGINVANPEDFEEPTVFSMDHCRINAGLLSLLGGVVEITEARFDKAVLTIVRNKQNRINAQEISKSLPRAKKEPESPAKPEPQSGSGQEQPEQAEAMELPKILIKELSLETLLEYFDHKLREETFRIGLQTKVSAKNITTFDSPDYPEGTVTINAHLDDNPDLFVTDIKGVIAPLSDPAAPTYSFDGSIVNIDLSEKKMQDLCKEANFKADSAALEIHVKCIDGIYQHPDSVIKLKLKNCKPVGEIARQDPNLPAIPEISATLHLEGAYNRPELENPAVVIGTAILSNLANNANLLMDYIGRKTRKHDKKIQEKTKGLGGKIEKEMDRGMKSLGDLLNNLGK